MRDLCSARVSQNRCRSDAQLERIVLYLSHNMETRAVRATPARGVGARGQLADAPVVPWPHLRIATKQIALSGSGGDFFEVVSHQDGSVSAALADVCGNGPQAALVATSLRPVLRAALVRGGSPAAVLDALNRWLVRERTVEDDRFVTAVAVRIDQRRRHVELASAGHLGPFVRRRSGRVESLTSLPGVPLGMLARESYAEVSRALAPEDAVVLATDGITDALASPADPLGERALLGRLAWAPHAAAGICHALLRDGATPRDDATVAVLQLPPSRLPAA
jgi:serine phosphatase RsbU (regulator of sigma subunit)